MDRVWSFTCEECLSESEISCSEIFSPNPPYDDLERVYIFTCPYCDADNTVTGLDNYLDYIEQVDDPYYYSEEVF